MKGTNPAKPDAKHIHAFIQGYSRLLNDVVFKRLPKWKKQQILWRETKAEACMNNGTCLYCGCNMEARIYSDIGCEDPNRKCYPQMMDEQTWEEFKLENNIKIS